MAQVVGVPFVEVIENRSDLEALSRLSGVSLRQLYRLKSGQFSPSLRTRRDIEVALGGPLTFPKERERLVPRQVTPAYQSWLNMRQRVNDPNSTYYARYGGRGITICERWDSFENFLEDMGERPEGMTLDRIDNDGNYEPGNCRWATHKQQSANRSVSKVAH